MKFWAWVKQRGEGCDYTIACGFVVWRIEANSWEDAMKEARLLAVGNPNWEKEEDCDHAGHWKEDGRRDLSWIILAKVTREEEMPIRQWYDEAIEKRDETKRQERERHERAQYERLRRKYDN